MRHFAVIPVKHQSERLPNKNFRDFAKGQSLLERKIDQLQSSGRYTDVFVSSDSPLAQASAEKFGAKFIARPDSLCRNSVPWHDVIFEIVSSLPIEDDDVVSWCHVTSPLFSDFDRAIRKFESLSEEHDGLFAVAPLKRYILDTSGRPVNHSWEKHSPSQDLPNYSHITMALFMARKRDFLKARYVITPRAYAFETTEHEATDIDTEMEFKIARWLAE